MTGVPPKLPSVFEQLMAACAHAAMDPDQPRTWPTNPFSAGVRTGSATDRIFELLRASPDQWFEHAELMRLTGCSRGAIAWAVRYLHAHGRLVAVPSARRRPQGGGGPLLRYRYAAGGGGD